MKTEKLLKYTPKRIGIIIASLKSLDSKVTASEKAGISYNTFRNWYDNIPDFRDKVDNAICETRETIKTNAINSIISKFDTDYRAACWMLERMFPEEYGKKETIDNNMKIEQVKIKYVLPENTENQQDVPVISLVEPKQIDVPNEKKEE